MYGNIYRFQFFLKVYSICLGFSNFSSFDANTLFVKPNKKIIYLVHFCTFLYNFVS